MVAGIDVDMVEEELVAAPACGLHILVGGGGRVCPAPCMSPWPQDKNRSRKLGQDEGNYDNTSAHSAQYIWTFTSPFSFF